MQTKHTVSMNQILRIDRRSFLTGRTEGRIEAKINDILELLDSYGKIPEELRDRISDEQDMNVLKKWLLLAAKVSSVEEFAEQLY